MNKRAIDRGNFNVTECAMHFTNIAVVDAISQLTMPLNHRNTITTRFISLPDQYIPFSHQNVHFPGSILIGGGHVGTFHAAHVGSIGR